MIIRFVGAVCLMLGAMVVMHDLVTIFAYGEADASLLVALLGLAQWSGSGEWQAFLMWLAPIGLGVAMFLYPRQLPRLRR